MLPTTLKVPTSTSAAANRAIYIDRRAAPMAVPAVVPATPQRSGTSAAASAAVAAPAPGPKVVDVVVVDKAPDTPPITSGRSLFAGAPGERAAAPTQAEPLLNLPEPGSRPTVEERRPSLSLATVATWGAVALGTAAIVVLTLRATR